MYWNKLVSAYPIDAFAAMGSTFPETSNFPSDCGSGRGSDREQTPLATATGSKYLYSVTVLCMLVSAYFIDAFVAMGSTIPETSNLPSDSGSGRGSDREQTPLATATGSEYMSGNAPKFSL